MCVHSEREVLAYRYVLLCIQGEMDVQDLRSGEGLGAGMGCGALWVYWSACTIVRVRCCRVQSSTYA